MDDMKTDLEDLAVLVVEDHPHMAAILTSMLHSWRIGTIHVVENTRDALEALRKHPVDIVLLDHNIAPVNGIDFVHLLRREPNNRNRRVPVIMVSGSADLATVTRARNSGVDEFLCKPVSAADLYERIRSVLDAPRPFICTDGYVGPCRRRRNDPPPDGIERRRCAHNSRCSVVYV